MKRGEFVNSSKRSGRQKKSETSRLSEQEDKKEQTRPERASRPGGVGGHQQLKKGQSDSQLASSGGRLGLGAGCQRTTKHHQSTLYDENWRISIKSKQVASDTRDESQADELEFVVDDIEVLRTLEDRLRARKLSAKKNERRHRRGHFQQGEPEECGIESGSDDSEVNLSFSGCGFLGIYHVGVASCFHEYAPQLSMHKISGSSAGALVAMAHICGNLQLAYCTTDFLTVAIEARSHTLGPFHPSFDIQASVREALERGLPEDAHVRATGKLHVSLTRVEDGENVIINEFNSNEDLIKVLLCSCFIPFWSGLRLPKYKGVTYIDGGFSDNLLTLDDKTVIVSPFAGEADICPQDDTLNLLQIYLSNTSFLVSPNNLYRLSHALLPPAPEVLSELCKQGFADGIRFLQRKNLISCTRCLEIRSSLLVTSEDMEDMLSMGGQSEGHHTPPGGEPRSFRHIILEQQEQEFIEISSLSACSSFVSTKSQIFTHHHHQRQQQQQQQRQQQQQQQQQLDITSALWDLFKARDDRAAESVQITHCDDCNFIRLRALYDPLPQLFSDRIRDACDRVNKSLSNWIYSHRPVKYLSYLIVPYYLPIDFTLAVIYRCWKKLPFIGAEIREQISHLLDLVIEFLRRLQSRSTSARLMGFGSSWEEDVLAYEKELIRQNQEITQVHYHHHHHHHHHSNINLPTSTAPACAGVGFAPPTL